MAAPQETGFMHVACGPLEAQLVRWLSDKYFGKLLGVNESVGSAFGSRRIWALTNTHLTYTQTLMSPNQRSSLNTIVLRGCVTSDSPLPSLD